MRVRVRVRVRVWVSSRVRATALVGPIHEVSDFARKSMVCCDAPSAAASAGSADEAGSTVATLATPAAAAAATWLGLGVGLGVRSWG